MSILVLAPTLKTPSGHDHAFCTELIRYASASDVRVLASEKFQPEPDLPAAPFFSVDPYEYRWIHKEGERSVPWRTLLRSAAQDLQKIDFLGYDQLILHTADPIHLVALSRSLRRFDGVIYIGFMLPPSFWLPESVGRRILSVASDLAIHSLKRKARVVLYSETGAIRFDHRSRGCLLKLPPVQRVAIAKTRASGETSGSQNSRIQIGFFGAPFDDKGFQILLQLAANPEIQSRFLMKVFLPPGQQELADKLNGGALLAMPNNGAITATSEERDLPTYFGCISSVDLVYTLYSPRAYRDRMSGIVQDALLAGKPLLVTTDCVDVRRFIDRIAPGAYIHSDYSAPSAATCLASAVNRLSNLSKQARAGTEKIRKLKTFEAYFDTEPAITKQETPSYAGID